MYKIPDHYNASILKDAIVQQICFAINNIVISFKDIGYIQIESSFALLSPTGEMIIHKVYPITQDNGILRLLEKKVIDVQINKTRTNLVLKFEDKNALEIISEPMYESYYINLGDQTMII